MKICILTKNPNAFDDRIYFKLARSLNKIGEVYIINPSISQLNAEEDIKFIQKKAKSGSDLKWIVEELRKIKPSIIHVTEPFLLKPAAYYKNIELVKIIYDPAEDWISMYEDFSRKIWPVPRILSYYIKKYENFYISQVDHLISSDKWLYEYYTKKGPCSLIYNYPNSDLFNINFKSIVKIPYSCVYHGQLRKERGLFLMIEALKIIKKDIKNIKLNLIGTFSYKSEKNKAYDLINSYDLNENINISSQIPHSMIAHTISENMLGLIPLFDIKKFRRNLPMKIFEYNACKLPIVSSALPPSKNHINNIQCGICVTPNSVLSLAEGIKHLFNNKKIYNRFRDNGYNAYLGNMQWEFQEESLFKIYTNL